MVLAEFGTERDPRFPDRDTDPTTAGPIVFDGPLHNAIPQPNRAVDNSTIWQADYNADYYRDLYFGETAGAQSLKQYYERQSSGRYSVDGMVTDWVKVHYNEARYGRSDDDPTDANGDDPNVCRLQRVLHDLGPAARRGEPVDRRPKGQRPDGCADRDHARHVRSAGPLRLRRRRQLPEKDGYIDHFQVVHSGGDQADGDPYQGEDAIWSHRWYAYFQRRSEPPARANNPMGGTQIGTTGLWVG